MLRPGCSLVRTPSDRGHRRFSIVTDTVSASVEVINRLGLHARASAKFCKLASSFNGDITVTNEGYSVRGDSVLDLLMLVAHQGSILTIAAKGSDAEEAVQALVALVNERFGESD